MCNNLAMTATSIRARVRAELTDEIKTVARRHLATDGANLSLRAVARDLGMASSALYRYFPSRDDLLTALIIDAYDALGAAVEAADAAVADRTDLRGRWRASCHAVRDWALAKPAEYALVYGSPVPGYAAPRDTIGPATRTPRVLLGILADGTAAGLLATGRPDLPDPVRTDLTRLRSDELVDIPEPVLARGTIAWIQLFGAVSFEVFGQLDNVFDDRAAYFDHQLEVMSDLVGLPS